MKKLYLLMTAALLSSGMALAQDNLALGGTASSPKGDAAAAIDNNEGTRWEFPAGDITDETDAVWNIDLGTSQEFNTVQILWETACSEEFKIYASDDADNFSEPILHVTGNTAGLQTYKLDNAVTARYVKFENLKRGTQWGVSFFEFRLFKMADAVLTSIDLKAAQTVVKVNTPVALTAQGKDQLGGNIDAGEVTYAVNPDDAGAVVNGVYTPAKAGMATVTANVGEIISNAVTVTAYAGEKIDISTNMASMVTPLGKETTTGSMVGAFDDNMLSVWELHANTGDDEESRTYDTGFVIDFGALYDITAVSLSFEGAHSQEYTIAFAGQDGEYTTVETYYGNANAVPHNEFYVENSENVRYVKFLSTKAGSQWGVKLYDFSVYGEKKGDLADTAAPTDVTATLVSTSFSSATLKLKATDDVSSVISYEISYKNGEETKTVTASGASGAETIYTVAGLNASTEYTFSVVAKDAKGNEAAAVEVTAKTTELVAAPIPAVDADNVMSIYSDKYGNAEALNTNPNWDQATINTPIKIGEDNAIMLSNLNYQGIEFTKMDVSEMEKLHIDIYAVDNTTLDIFPIWRNADDSGNANEIKYTATGLKLNAWNSLDIDLTEFADEERKSTNLVYQIKFVAENNPTFILDNIYFHKTGAVDEVPPVFAEGYPKAEAALNTVTVTVKGSDDIKSKVTFAVTCDEETKIVVANNDEEATVTFEGLEDGEYTFSVTVSDGTNTSEAKTVKATVSSDLGEKIVINPEFVAVAEGTQTNDVANAFDDDTNSQWILNNGASEDASYGFTADLKGLYSVNTISIIFEGACSKDFNVELLDKDKAVVAKKEITDLKGGAGENPTSTFPMNGENVRYIKFTSTAAYVAGWGVKIKDFSAYGKKTGDIAPELSTITLASELEGTFFKADAENGTELAITTIALDQNGDAIETEIEYVISDEAVVAYDNENKKFMAKKAGEVTVQAKAGDIVSNTLSFYVVNDDAIVVNPANVTVDEGVVIDGVEKAFDGNVDTQWNLIADNEDGEKGFIIDLEDAYDLSSLAIVFEGACSKNYTVEFLDADNSPLGKVSKENVEGGPGKTVVKYDGVSAAAARYVKFTNLEAYNAAWGMHIKEFTLYGKITPGQTPRVKAVDVTVEETVKTGSEVVVDITATDQYGNEYEGETTVTYETSDAAVIAVENDKLVAKAAGTVTVTITVNGITVEKTITVEDAKAALLSVTAEKTTVEVGENINLAVVVKDQFGDVIENAPVEYTVENGLGTVENNVFTATAVGTGNIIARLDGCEDLMIEMTVQDTTAPENLTVTATPTIDAITLTISADDNSKGVITYTISYKKQGDAEATEVTVTAASGENATYTINGLTDNTAYEITVTATDENGNAVTSDTTVTNTVSGIRGIKADGSVEDGTVVYDLTGKRVEKVTKGIFIINGKKVVVK